MFNFFKKKNKEVINKENITENKIDNNEIVNETNFFDNEECINDVDLYLNKLFECEKLYTFVFRKPPKAEKYYMQVINSELVGFLYSDRDKAESYFNNELKYIQKQGLFIKEIATNEILDYVHNLKENNINGIIINYPYNWIVFNIKN